MARSKPTIEAPQATRARAALANAVTALKRGATATGPLYGQVVRAVNDCVKAGMIRTAIATLIAETWAGGSKQKGDVSKGIAARYITLARWARGEYTESETEPRRGVSVSGLMFKSPLDALASGKVTFSATYQAWRESTRPARAARDIPSDPFKAGAAAVAKMRVLMTVDGEIKRIKLADSPQAMAGALQALMRLPSAERVLPVQTRHHVEGKVIPFTRPLRRGRAA